MVNLKYPINSAVSEPELRALLRLAEGKRVIECGALLGFSTIHLGATAGSLISIDRHKGYGPDTLNPFLSNITTHCVDVEPLVGDCVDLLPQVVGDIAFLDLDGTLNLTRSALLALHKSVSICAVHDLTRNSCHGVEEAILHTHGWRLHEAVGTLGILVRES